MGKCEICGADENLTTVSVQTPRYDPRVFSSVLCENCYKKYRTTYLLFFYGNQTVAQNLVREYNEKRKDGFSWIKARKE